MRRFLSMSAACTLPRVQWSDEALMTCVQSYFAAYSPVSAPQQQPLPRVVPLPGSAIPQLHDLSLWELVRLLKVMEDMTTVSAFPRLRTELLLRHAVRLIAALPWGAATAQRTQQLCTPWQCAMLTGQWRLKAVVAVALAVVLMAKAGGITEETGESDIQYGTMQHSSSTILRAL